MQNMGGSFIGLNSSFLDRKDKDSLVFIDIAKTAFRFKQN